MSVTWKCNRCSKSFEDRAAMVSYPPAEWQAFALTKVVKEHGGDFKDAVVDIFHFCNHCASLPNGPKIEIK